MATDDLLVMSDLHVDFMLPTRTVHAVRGLDLQVQTGEVVGLVGESGSGKSVSCLSVLGLLPPQHTHFPAGSIRFRGQELLGMPTDAIAQIRGREIAMVFQDALSALNPRMSVGAQIGEALVRHLGLTKKAARARSIELLALVGISSPASRVDAFPHQLSGGMRQRVMIAMAISCGPSLLIADEPTTALDVTVQAQILDLLRDLQREFAMAILLVTHDLGVVAGIADRVVVMYSGRAVEDGPAGVVLSSPQHPYTRGLLRCVPRIDLPKQAQLDSIEGSPPDLSLLIQGCAFTPRCDVAIEVCAGSRPSMEYVGSSQQSCACWVASAERVRQ
jgi:oligopeptide transport system ATP-binding protein